MKNIKSNKSKALFIFTLLVSLTFSCSDDENVTKDQAPDTWIVVADLNEELTKVQFLDDNTGFALGEQSIFKTIDGGTTWTSLSLPANSEIVLDMHTFGESNIAALLDINGVRKCIKSGNAGNSWTEFSVPNNLLKNILFTSSAVGFIWRVDSNYPYWDTYESFRTDDGGVTWKKNKNSSDQTVEMVNFAFTTSSVGYASEYGELWKTIDGGNSWLSIVESNEIRKMKVNAEKLYAISSAGSQDGVFRLNETENELQYISENLFIMNITSFDFDNELGFQVGNQNEKGLIVITKDGSSTWGKEILPAIRENTNSSFTITDVTIINTYAYAVGSRPDASGNEKPGFVLKYKK